MYCTHLDPKNQDFFCNSLLTICDDSFNQRIISKTCGIVDGKEVKMTVKVGDKVLTSKYSGTEVKVDGEECTIVRQGDILAVVED